MGFRFNDCLSFQKHPDLISLYPIDLASPVQPAVRRNPSVDDPPMDTTTVDHGTIMSQCICDRLQPPCQPLFHSADSNLLASSTVTMPSSHNHNHGDGRSSSVLCMVCCKKSVSSAESSSKASAMCETCGGFVEAGSGEAGSSSLSRCASEKSLKDITWQVRSRQRGQRSRDEEIQNQTLMESVVRDA